MTSVLVRLAALVALTIGVLLPVAGRAPIAAAQGTLGVQLTENPFLCNASVRPLGTVVGLIPGEQVEFSSPQLNGVFSRRVADASGHVSMRWNCDAPQTWDVTVRGVSSGASTSFQITGRAAPPPPDAPIGAAFDAKSAMTAAQMAIWKDFSPFDTVGVYIDVNASWDNRADKLQTNLTADWVSQIFADGWKIIPIYVGYQAPDQCATARYHGLSADPGTARSQGLASAADAVASVRALGIGAGNPIYYDMEAYRPGCAEAVLAFLDAWTEGVHAEGYLSGVYGSRASTMFDLSRSLGRPGFDAPDAVWVSTGNGQATSFGLEVPNDGQWANARMHQYRLGITRTYGGVTREIDENIVNAPVARPGGSVAPSAPTVPAAVDNDGDGFTEPSPDNCDRVANPDQADLDGDGDGDVCDRDIDGDGVDNVMDFAPRDPTVSAAPAPTAAAAPTAAPSAAPTAQAAVDSDGDGFAEPSPDNCDDIANPDQADQDGDGDGDLCDDDIDGDGVSNAADAAPADPNVGIPLASDPAPATATAEPTPQPTTAAPTAAPSTAEPAETPTAEPTTSPEATAPQVVVLPTVTPAPAVQPTAPVPTPTASPTATPGVESLADLDSAQSNPLSDATGAPDGTGELAADTVTIEVEDDSSLPYALVALGIFSLFCAAMGVRSFLDNRTPTI